MVSNKSFENISEGHDLDHFFRNPKNHKIDENIKSEKIFFSTVQLDGKYILSKYRKKLKKDIKEQLLKKSYLEQEKIVSDQLVENKLYDSHPPFCLQLIIELYSNCSLKVIYKNILSSQSILNYMKFTIDSINIAINQHLNEQVQIVKNKSQNVKSEPQNK